MIYRNDLKIEFKAKTAGTIELHKKIDANKEEVIEYLKSIGAI